VKGIEDFCRGGMPVSRTILAERALEVSREAAIPRGTFSASACWIRGLTAVADFPSVRRCTKVKKR
jgi:hypothetical protein